jgi:hypothetical protein
VRKHYLEGCNQARYGHMTHTMHVGYTTVICMSMLLSTGHASVCARKGYSADADALGDVNLHVSLRAWVHVHAAASSKLVTHHFQPSIEQKCRQAVPYRYARGSVRSCAAIYKMVGMQSRAEQQTCA